MNHKGKQLVMVLILLLVSGCTLHRPAEIKPPGMVPESFIEIRGKGGMYTLKRWWEIFGDDRLNALMDEAFLNNLDIGVAFARLKQLQANMKSTKALEFPTLHIDGKAGKGREPGLSGPSRQENYSLSVAASYEVDLWRRLSSRTKASILEKEASLEDLKALFLSLSAELADFYFLAIEQRAQLVLTDKTIRSYEEMLKLIEERYREGLVSALDIYQARQNLFSVMSKRSVFEANLATAEHAISVLLGHYPERGISGSIERIPEVTLIFPLGLPSELLQRRPDIKSKFLSLRASDYDITAAIAERFPSFNLLGEYGRSRTVLSTGDLSGLFWSILLDVSQPLFDAGRRKAEIERNQAIFEERLAEYHKTVINAFREVEDALAKNYATEERIKHLEKELEATKGALRVSIDRYLQGLSDYLPVLTAQALHFNTQSQLLSARRQLLSDRISLARALGGGWMAEEIEKYKKVKEGERSNL